MSSAVHPITDVGQYSRRQTEQRFSWCSASQSAGSVSGFVVSQPRALRAKKVDMSRRFYLKTVCRQYSSTELSRVACRATIVAGALNVNSFSSSSSLVEVLSAKRLAALSGRSARGPACPYHQTALSGTTGSAQPTTTGQ